MITDLYNFYLDEERTLPLVPVPPRPPRGLKKAKLPFSVWKCTSLEESLLQGLFAWKSSAARL